MARIKTVDIITGGIMGGCDNAGSRTGKATACTPYDSAGLISASMMCASLTRLRETVDSLERKRIDYLHIDMMDGRFVPNFGLGVDYVRELRRLTSIPLDLHLMICEPEYKLSWIGIEPSDIVSIHYESTPQVQRALDCLKPYGCKRFLAINPATPVCMLEEVLDHIDGVNLLMVNPGFAGQAMVKSAMAKADKLFNLLTVSGRSDIMVEVDGNITPENAEALRKKGASIFVAGTSSVFAGSVDCYETAIDRLRRAIL